MYDSDVIVMYKATLSVARGCSSERRRRMRGKSNPV